MPVSDLRIRGSRNGRDDGCYGCSTAIDSSNRHNGVEQRVCHNTLYYDEIREYRLDSGNYQVHKHGSVVVIGNVQHYDDLNARSETFFFDKQPE